ncbi:MAG: HPr family phosphocarrier protein [Rhodobiaceae bacterium]|nr:HPr family phosphocarrier protein [Rhodobiaceae bacterium]
MSADAGKVFEDASAVSSRVTICNAKGLHARASAKFVRLAEQFRADIAVRRGKPPLKHQSLEPRIAWRRQGL